MLTNDCPSLLLQECRPDGCEAQVARAGIEGTKFKGKPGGGGIISWATGGIGGDLYMEEHSLLFRWLIISFLYLFMFVFCTFFFICNSQSFLHTMDVRTKLLQSCLTLCDPMGCSLQGFLQGILQARILEWVAMPFSRGSSPSRD